MCLVTARFPPVPEWLAVLRRQAGAQLDVTGAATGGLGAGTEVAVLVLRVTAGAHGEEKRQRDIEAAGRTAVADLWDGL
jgi:hypothetical protein